MADDPQPADEQQLTSLRARDDETPVGVIATEDIPVLGGTRNAAAPETVRAAAEPLQAGGKGKGKSIVRTRFPVDRFEHSVEGVDAITAEGVEVDTGKAADLLEAARTAGITLEVIS